MKIGAFKRALGLTLLYIGVFVVIVLVQFSRGPGLSERIGGLTVRATYPKAERAKAGAAPDMVRLGYAGLSFEISAASVAESLGPDGAASTLALASIERLPNGVLVKLSPGVAITATVDGGATERFVLAANAPDGVAAVRLRLRPSRTSSLVAKDGRRILASEGKSYELGLGAASLDGSLALLSLKPGDPGLALAALAPAPAKPVVAAAAPDRSTMQPAKDPAAFKAEIAAWRDKAWAGLSSARFDPEKVAWKGGDGLPSFSEKALSAYLAEALARGSYAEAFARVRGAREKWPARLGYLSAPYFGGLIPKMRDLEASDLAESKRLAQLVADKSPALLEKEGLLRFLVDRSPSALAQEALRIVAGLDAAKLTLRQSVGLLGCAVDARSLLKDEENPFRDMGAATDRLVAAVGKTAGGYFLATEEDGSCDVRLSALAGGYLAAYGAAAGKPVLVGAGQGLVEGALGLADAQGFAPARVLARGGAIDQRTGSLPPEELYAAIADNPYYPHEVSFSRELSPGLWAWTCAPFLTVQATPARYVFTARFLEGGAHFLAFYGVKPFVNIQLYDIDYSPDGEFESYDASGYLYNKPAGALYLKMKHKKESEGIKLSF